VLAQYSAAPYWLSFRNPEALYHLGGKNSHALSDFKNVEISWEVGPSHHLTRPYRLPNTNYHLTWERKLS
jgi:hypothetical protein